MNSLFVLFLVIISGEPTVGKTKPETILRQLTTKKGQVLLYIRYLMKYSMCCIIVSLDL